MMTMQKVNIAAIVGFLGVALGAFGAHGLKAILSANDTASIWQTAVFYHITHSVASLWATDKNGTVVRLWTIGIAIFSGSLYLLAVTNARWLGAITPIGGSLLIAGWVALAWASRKES